MRISLVRYRNSAVMYLESNLGEKYRDKSCRGLS